jgi:hypothetical protein
MFSGTVSIFFIVILTFCAELCLIMPYLVIVGKRSVGILLSDVSLTLLANYVCLVIILWCQLVRMSRMYRLIGNVI